MAAPWTCPFCDRDTTITAGDVFSEQHFFTIENSDGPRLFKFGFVVCPNPKCKKATLSAYLYKAEQLSTGSYYEGDLIKHWSLIPPSKAKVFPDYIPKPILEDYQEACLIRDLSPKSSATLARRCLQGMIRDFWGIKKNRLKDEIDALEDKVDSLIWKAIDAIRSLGNIGAHMEKDVNLVVEVEPKEANQLIELLEMLIKDWYITRHEREERLKAAISLAEQKEQARAQPADQGKGKAVQ